MSDEPNEEHARAVRVLLYSFLSKNYEIESRDYTEMANIITLYFDEEIEKAWMYDDLANS